MPDGEEARSFPHRGNSPHASRPLSPFSFARNACPLSRKAWRARFLSSVVRKSKRRGRGEGESLRRCLESIARGKKGAEAKRQSRRRSNESERAKTTEGGEKELLLPSSSSAAFSRTRPSYRAVKPPRSQAQSVFKPAGAMIDGMHGIDAWKANATSHFLLSQTSVGSGERERGICSGGFFFVGGGRRLWGGAHSDRRVPRSLGPPCARARAVEMCLSSHRDGESGHLGGGIEGPRETGSSQGRRARALPLYLAKKKKGPSSLSDGSCARCSAHSF